MQLFWESNGVYVVPRSDVGNKLVFSQAGPSTQMVQLEANLVGIFNLRFYTVDEDGRKTFLAGVPEVVNRVCCLLTCTLELRMFQIELVVRRQNIQKKIIITIVVALIISLALALMGLDLDMEVVLATLKVITVFTFRNYHYSCFQKPVGPLIGLFCQFIMMPVFSYFLGWLFLETNYEQLGLLLLGCSPGGAPSNFWVRL